MLLSFLKAKAANSKAKLLKSKASDLEQVKNVLDFFESNALYPDFRVIEDGVNEPRCVIGGKQYLQFCSNNYLSLTEHPEVKEAAIKSIKKYGVGPGGSRVVSGNVDVIVELERRISNLVGAEDCITFPTGYMANVGLFRALMDPFFNDMPFKAEEGTIFSDESNHGSIVDGCRLSKVKKVVFRHDDINDLETKLKQSNARNKLIVTEGVFSTDGEIINIPNYISLAKKYNALLMVDDAHGVGVLGDNGGGVASMYNCGKDIDVLMGSMDKAFGGTGGYICGSKTMIKYLRVGMRSSLLSSAIPTAAAAAMIKSIDLIEAGKSKRDNLFANAKYLKDCLEEKGFKVLGDSTLPAVPLLLGAENDALNFSAKLYDEGIFTSVFRWPAVPLGKARLRISLMSNHTKADIDELVSACTRIGKSLSVIK